MEAVSTHLRGAEETIPAANEAETAAANVKRLSNQIVPALFKRLDLNDSKFDCLLKDMLSVRSLPKPDGLCTLGAPLVHHLKPHNHHTQQQIARRKRGVTAFLRQQRWQQHEVGAVVTSSPLGSRCRYEKPRVSSVPQRRIEGSHRGGHQQHAAAPRADFTQRASAARNGTYRTVTAPQKLRA